MMEFLNPDPYIKKYLYELFRSNNDADLVQYMTYGIIIYAISVLLLPIAAPYGRYTSKWFGFGIPPRFAWCVQECPAFIIPFLMVITGKRPAYSALTNQICLGLYMMHYFQRSFIYPLLMKSKNNAPFLLFFFAFLTNVYNGILHAIYFANLHKYDDKIWLYKPFLWIGIVIFLIGMKINIGSDHTLRNLRTGTDKSYKIPQGGMFSYVSCANYFGEILEMWGYALASFAPPAIAHALFTSCFLTKRATQHHQWYLKKFENYPKERRAIIPYLI